MSSSLYVTLVPQGIGHLLLTVGAAQDERSLVQVPMRLPSLGGLSKEPDTLLLFSVCISLFISVELFRFYGKVPRH